MKVTKGERSSNLMYLIAKPICFLVHKSTVYNTECSLKVRKKILGQNVEYNF